MYPLIAYTTIRQESIIDSHHLGWLSMPVWDLVLKHVWFCEAIDYNKTGLFSTLHIRTHGPQQIMVEMQTHVRNK